MRTFLIISVAANLLCMADAAAFQIATPYVSDDVQSPGAELYQEDIQDVCVSALKSIGWELQVNGYKVEGTDFFGPDGDVLRVECNESSVRVSRLTNGGM